MSETLSRDTFGGAVKTAVKVETVRQMTLTAIAIKRFQLRSGSLPETLERLIPDLLAELPVDWMDGHPLRYAPKENGTFLLYSVGQDGRDDGGDPSMPDPKKPPQLSGRDTVWPMPAETP